MTLERYCSCGAVLRVIVPKAKRDQALAIWYSYHSGDGHAPATRKQAKEQRTS